MGQNLHGTLFNGTKQKGGFSIKTCLKLSIFKVTWRKGGFSCKTCLK